MRSHVHNEPFIIRPNAQLLKDHPDLGQRSHALMRKYCFRELVTDGELKAMGERLWQVLKMDAEFEVAKNKAGRAILPIIIESDQATIQQLPWETLHHPKEGFLGKSTSTTLSRQISKTTSCPLPLKPGPLRVLLFTTLPDDLDAERARLKVEEEQAQVQEALLPWIAQGIVELEMPDDGRFATLREKINGFQPHVLFLSGHGKYHHQPHSDDPPYATFLFESEAGHSEAIREDEVAKAFDGSWVQCVVLSSCESGKTASDELNTGLTHCLSQKGIPHVVGMRESILDRAGILFAHAFCDAIANQEPMEVAVQKARQAITSPMEQSTWRDSEGSGLNELSLGQWCLPMLISKQTGQPLIEWDFAPKKVESERSHKSLKNIALPPRFLGRRSELRQLSSRLHRGQLQQLLISGPGGQGKTALAGRLVEDCQRRGDKVFAWSAQAGNTWHKFLFELELQLSEENAQRYDRMVKKLEDEDESEKAELLLGLLLRQSPNRIVLFLDNLESIQDPDTLALNDPEIEAWIKAAQSLLDEGLILFLTTRWRLPQWPEDEHWSLEHANYGDFLQMAQHQELPATFFRSSNRLHRLYQTLQGNGRGLQFFIAAIASMDVEEEEVFLEKLAQAETEIQTNMALEQIIGHLNEQEKQLLEILPAYHTPVPLEGVIKLALDLPVEPLLFRLVSVSLVEKSYDADWKTYQYQCSSLVVHWLQTQEKKHIDPELMNHAAEYQHYLFRWERKTVGQALIVHQAWQAAGNREDANRFALDFIVGPLNRRGLYQTLLQEWLPDICQSENEKITADGLNQTGKQHHHLGDYERALDYLQQSLAISQEIGDKSGEGSTLNNISQIFKARGDTNTALDYLQQSLAIRQEIGDKSGEGTTLNNISTIFHSQGDTDRALDYLQQSLAIRQEIGDKSGEGTTLNNISQIFDSRGDTNTALDYLQQSLAIRQEIGDKSGEGVTLNNISQIYDARGDYDRALDYLQQSLSIQQEIGDKSGEGVTLNNISQIYDARGDYDRALDYLQQSLAISQEIGDKSGEGTTLNNISQIFDSRGDYDTALDYLRQSLAIQQEIGDKEGLCATLFNMGHIHRQNEEMPQALQCWLTAYRMAKPMQLQQALDALEGLGKKLGWPDGLEGWEQLGQKMEEAEQKMEQEKKTS